MASTMKGRTGGCALCLTPNAVPIGSNFEAIDPELALAITEMPPVNADAVQRARPPFPK